MANTKGTSEVGIFPQQPSEPFSGKRAVLRGHAQDCHHYNTSIVQQGIRAIVLDIQRTMEHPLSQLLEYADTSAKHCSKEVLSISLFGLLSANRPTLHCGFVEIVVARKHFDGMYSFFTFPYSLKSCENIF